MEEEVGEEEEEEQEEEKEEEEKKILIDLTKWNIRIKKCEILRKLFTV